MILILVIIPKLEDMQICMLMEQDEMEREDFFRQMIDWLSPNWSGRIDDCLQDEENQSQ